MDDKEVREEIANCLYDELTYQNYLSIPEVRANADKKIDQILTLINELTRAKQSEARKQATTAMNTLINKAVKQERERIIGLIVGDIKLVNFEEDASEYCRHMGWREPE